MPIEESAGSTEPSDAAARLGVALDVEDSSVRLRVTLDAGINPTLLTSTC